MHPLTQPITRAAAGNTIFYGVREFGMTAIANGIALHGGFLPYVATFLMFSDYARNAVRMGALMRLRVVHVYTHDSIGLGEDGPTHQPVEQVESLRLIPNLDVWRPCDAVETAAAWRAAVTRTDGPTALALSRQALAAPAAHGRADRRDPPRRLRADRAGGAAGGDHRRDRLGSGSSRAPPPRSLQADGVAVRVVSMPCVEIFEAQDAAWRHAVLPPQLPVVTVEAGATRGWWRYAGRCGAVIGIDRFGESAPAPVLFDYFGFTPDRVADAVREAIARTGPSAVC